MVRNRAFVCTVVFAGAFLGIAVDGAAETFYVAQSATGSGSSCASALPVSWFNNSGNWSSPKQAGRIGPGDTIQLCGTLTTGLTLQGSGASGAAVTIDGSGANLGTSFGFESNNKSWWVIQNVTWNAGANNLLLSVSGGSNGTLRNAVADDIHSGTAIWLNQYMGAVLPNNITIQDSYLRTGSTNYGNAQHDMIKTEGSTNVVIEGNYLEMRAGGAGSEAHDDIIQTFEKGGTSAGNPSNWTIRYNWLVMNSAESSDRSWTMLESLSGTINIYGNVFLGLKGADGANGLNVHNSSPGVVFNIYNNTFVSKGTASNNVLNLQDAGTANIINNIFHLKGQTALTGSMAKNRSYNLWFGSNIPSCSGTTGEVCGVDPMFTDYSANAFAIQSSSLARGSGKNLGSGTNGQTLDHGVAPGANWPGPALQLRGTTWDRGAFQSAVSPGTAPAAAQNVRVIR